MKKRKKRGKILGRGGDRRSKLVLQRGNTRTGRSRRRKKRRRY